MQTSAAHETGAEPPDHRLLLPRSEFEAHASELAELRSAREREAAHAGDELDLTVLDARISRLDELLLRAQVIEDADAADVACVGALVDVEYLRTGRKVTLQLTGDGAPEVAGRGPAVSPTSPVGSALMGRRCGETVTAHLPGGHVEELRIGAISRLRLQ